MNCRNNAHLFAMLALLLAGLLLSGRSGAADQAPAAPGEILVGLRASDDRAEVAASLAQTIGPVAAHHVALHTYRMQLKSGLLLQNALAQLKARPEVLYAEPNYLVHSAATPNDTGYANQYGPQKVQADLAWCLWSPQQTVIIAIVDTGIDNTHPDLTNKILRDSSGNIIGYNALTSATGAASDDNGHGTHCAGIAA